MKLFVWFDLVGLVDLLAWLRMIVAIIEFIILLNIASFLICLLFSRVCHLSLLIISVTLAV